MKSDFIRLSSKISVFLIVLSIGVFWKAQAFGQEWSAAQKELLKMEEAGFVSWARGDVEGYLKNVHKDSAYWPAIAKKPVDKATIRQYVESFPLHSYSFKLKPLSVKIFGNVAIVQYYCTFIPYIGPATSLRVTSILMKEDGRWQVIGKMSGVGIWLARSNY